MKRTLRLFSLVAALFLALTSSQKAHAQITALAANFWDSSSNYCNVPADVSGFAFIQ